MNTALSKDLLKRLGDLNALPQTEAPVSEFIPTGSYNLDWILGGGLPRGAMIYFYGDQFSGKTTMSLLIARHISETAEKMKNGGRVAYFDIEGGVHPRWFSRLGIDPKMVHLIQPVCGEDAGDAMCAMIEANAYDLIVYDSIAQTAWNAELEGEMGDNHMAVGARMWGKFWKKAYPLLRQSHTAMIMTNQLSDSMDQYNKDYQTGGKRITRHAPMIRLNFMKPEEGKLKVGGQIISYVDFRPSDAKKNRIVGVRNPKGDMKVRMLTGVPKPFIDVVPELSNQGKELLVFTNKDGLPVSGSAKWFYNSEPVADGGGEPPVLARLYSDADFRGEIQNAVTQAILSQSLSVSGGVTKEDDDTDEGGSDGRAED